MDVRKVAVNGQQMAIVRSKELCVKDGQSALDFIMTIHYETQCRSIILNKEAVIEEFFVLSTKIAGDVLQKFSNYHFKFAIVGDFSSYTSKALKDFIYESNQGNQIFFVATEEEAIRKLSQ